MKLYVVTASGTSYDEFDSFVVAARSPKDARKVAHERLTSDYFSSSFKHNAQQFLTADVEFIGTAGTKVKRGVVHESFQAG